MTYSPTNSVKQVSASLFAKYLAHFPIRRGKRRLSRLVGPWLSGAVVKNAYGASMYTYYYDTTNRLAFEGRYGVVADFAQSLPSGAVFLDIGANQGGVSLIAGRAVGDSGIVLAFEPAPSTFQLLTRNIQLNNAGNIKAYNVAIGAQEKDGFLDGGEKTHTGTAAIGEHGVPIRIGTISEYMQTVGDEGEGRVYVKIDTEGYELEVLKGLQPLFDRKSIAALVLEIDERALRQFGASTDAVYGWLSDNGFDPKLEVSARRHYDQVFVPREAS